MFEGLITKLLYVFMLRRYLEFRRFRVFSEMLMAFLFYVSAFADLNRRVLSDNWGNLTRYHPNMARQMK